MTNSSKTLAVYLSFLMPVISLPSENVPAPPSPNCTFVSGASSPVAQNFCTASCRSRTAAPRSSTIGRSPASARHNAAIIPAGPEPATTGRKPSPAARIPVPPGSFMLPGRFMPAVRFIPAAPSLRHTAVKSSLSSGASSSRSPPASSAPSYSNSAAYTQNRLSLRRASSDFFATRKFRNAGLPARCTVCAQTSSAPASNGSLMLFRR